MFQQQPFSDHHHTGPLNNYSF